MFIYSDFKWLKSNNVKHNHLGERISQLKGFLLSIYNMFFIIVTSGSVKG